MNRVYVLIIYYYVETLETQNIVTSHRDCYRLFIVTEDDFTNTKRFFFTCLVKYFSGIYVRFYIDENTPTQCTTIFQTGYTPIYTKSVFIRYSTGIYLSFYRFVNRVTRSYKTNTSNTYFIIT